MGASSFASLTIDDLQVELESESGLVRAIDGMRLAIERRIAPAL